MVARKRSLGLGRIVRVLYQDAGYASRRLARSKSFSIVAIATLAFGIAAATAIFSVVDAVLLTPLPFEEPERLVMLTRDGDVSIPDGVDWRRESRTLSDIALILRDRGLTLTGSGVPQRLAGYVVEARLFALLGVKPALGRLLNAADDRRGGRRVCVISTGLWKRLGGGRDVVGRQLLLNDLPHTVVGVAPASLDLFGDGVEVWTPVAVEAPWALEERGSNNFDAIGRLAPGVELSEAQAELRTLSERLAKEHPRTNRDKVVIPISLLEFLVGDVRPALWVLLAAVAFLLAVSSGNLAGLLIARGARREGEFAIRLALGAGRGRLAGQLVIEGLLLALAGGAAGLALAHWAQSGLLELVPESLPRHDAVTLNLRVFAFSVATSAAVGLAFSVLPALHVARSEPSKFLGGGRTASMSRARQRLLGQLVVAEVALACLLLVGSGLLSRSLFELNTTSLGFDPKNLLTAAISLPSARYATHARQTETIYQLVQHMEETPGIEAAATVIGLPLETWGRIGHHLQFAGRPQAEPGQEPSVRSRPVAGDYFAAMRLPIVEGRAFIPYDHTGGPPVAIVNQRAARELWPGQSPLGDRIAWSYGNLESVWMTVVGVAANTRSASLVEGDVAAIYSPYSQRIVEWQSFASIAVRTELPAQDALRAVQQAVWSVDPTLPLARVATMRERRARAVAQDHLNAVLLGFFALMAVLMVVQGVYATLAYAVQQRRREIGVRVALGASRAGVSRLVLGSGLRMAVTGIALGLAGAIAVGSAVRSLLYGVAPHDPPTLLFAALVLLFTSTLGCIVPVTRAVRLDPVAALRNE